MAYYVQQPYYNSSSSQGSVGYVGGANDHIPQGWPMVTLAGNNAAYYPTSNSLQVSYSRKCNISNCETPNNHNTSQHICNNCNANGHDTSTCSSRLSQVPLQQALSVQQQHGQMIYQQQQEISAMNKELRKQKNKVRVLESRKKHDVADEDFDYYSDSPESNDNYSAAETRKLCEARRFLRMVEQDSKANAAELNRRLKRENNELAIRAANMLEQERSTMQRLLNLNREIEDRRQIEKSKDEERKYYQGVNRGGGLVSPQWNNILQTPVTIMSGAPPSVNLPFNNAMYGNNPYHITTPKIGSISGAGTSVPLMPSISTNKSNVALSGESTLPFDAIFSKMLAPVTTPQIGGISGYGASVSAPIAKSVLDVTIPFDAMWKVPQSSAFSTPVFTHASTPPPVFTPVFTPMTTPTPVFTPVFTHMTTPAPMSTLKIGDTPVAGATRHVSFIQQSPIITSTSHIFPGMGHTSPRSAMMGKADEVLASVD